jgi:CelD/BcsL family acetyltransferase involved in cellulose biosynthesis
MQATSPPIFSGGIASTVYQLDPLTDPRWHEFVNRHPKSSIFHTSEWLRALARSYQYRPVVVTTSPPGSVLDNGMVLCDVRSWLTGRRWVSVPFSDHCDILTNGPEASSSLITLAVQQLLAGGVKYVEIRPRHGSAGDPGPKQSQRTYVFHELDLSPSIDELFKSFHGDSTQRKIRRAEREGLRYAEGNSKQFLEQYRELALLTRKRHALPPQPLHWFQNLIDSFGPALKIRVAYKDAQPVASMITIQHKETLVYKYGSSDARFHNLGGMHLLFWKSIQEAKREGLRCLDFGRSDFDAQGLITFKQRWGAKRTDIIYSRFGATASRGTSYSDEDADWRKACLQKLVPTLPDALLKGVGSFLYKHIG